jgi:probable DNA repair protein
LYRLPGYLQAALESAATLVTAHARQAFAIRAAWAERQRSRGLTAWPTPDVLPLSAWLMRHWSQALGNEAQPELPLLLDGLQEHMLWEHIVTATARERGLLHPHGTASAARRTWQRVHDWAIDLRALSGAESEETRAFLGWSELVSQAMREHRRIDAPRALWQCPIVSPEADAGEILSLGFDDETPARRAWLERLTASGTRVRAVPPRKPMARAAKLGCADADDELRAAAWWARQRLERAPTDRLLIAIPDLEQRRARVERVLAEILEPASLLVNAAEQTGAFALEESVSLDRYPLVAAALTALELTAGPVAFDTASDWLRSPYWLGGYTQAAARARRDVQLRRMASPQLTLAMLIAALASSAWQQQEPNTLAALRRLHDELRGPSRMLGSWSEAFSRALAVIGWPGDRTLNSAEFQTVGKFKEALGALAMLDRLLGRLDLASAVVLFRRLLEQTAFQPETGDAAITVTSRLGDPVLTYDGIWVSGMHAAAWPEPPRPDPFIPWPVQAAVGMPGASARSMVERAQRALASWMASADEVILSWPARRDEELYDPSPLIVALPDLDPSSLRRPRYSELIHASARRERIVDEVAPRVATDRPFRGGARAIRLQSLCPFRANAEQRWRAEPLEQPEPGIDARTRGSLIHRALEQIWSALPGSGALQGLSAEARASLIETAVAAASRDVFERGRRWSPATHTIETERLRALLGKWLDLEAAREPFTVLALERSFDCTVGAFSFRLRVDRLDQLADGRRALIDYKSGEADMKDWWGDRPGDPQIPLYAYVVAPAPAALAYAMVSAEGCRFEGVSAPPTALLGLRALDDWPTQLAAWRSVIERLASDFVAGRAAVDPLRAACGTCHLHALCRIDELRARAVRGAGDE